ncbi:hypothetical protein HNR40_007230 [Nonomuraea endophytica]|uniref:Uncharacterized protein n=1 Tax=Nonomuraea endophytica TaxID=714136 RepID=A0A7W8A8X4_9ACTN|nr:hypothetical protein [Nonomuraea endophytica]
MRALRVAWVVLMITLPGAGAPEISMLAWIIVMSVIFGIPAVRRRLLKKPAGHVLHRNAEGRDQDS